MMRASLLAIAVTQRGLHRPATVPVWIVSLSDLTALGAGRLEAAVRAALLDAIRLGEALRAKDVVSHRFYSVLVRS